MAGDRNDGGRTRAITFADKAQLILHLWTIAALLTLIVHALVS
jgi:hypothetical protein